MSKVYLHAREPAPGVIGSIPLGGPIKLFLVTASAILSMGWSYKRFLTAY